VTKPANDNDDAAVVAQLSITPWQAMQLKRMRALAEEMLELAAKLEEDLFDKAAKRKLLESIEPTTEDYAEMARLRRKRGLRNG